MTRLENNNQNKKLLLIVNPVSGKKTIMNCLPDVIKVYQDAGYVCTVMVTEKPGDARLFAQTYAALQDEVVCAGGDGTLNETISGLASADIPVPIGYIPCGTTNVFAESHGIPLDVIAAARASVKGTCHFYDLGKIEDNYFAFVAAFGAFSWLSYTTNQCLKNTLGKTAYFIEGIKDIKAVRSFRMKIAADGVSYEDDFLFGAVTNTASVGGIFELPKDTVNANDGVFELLLIHRPNSLKDFNVIIRSLLQQDYSSPYIELTHCKDIVIENPDAAEFSIDGENGGAPASASITVIREFYTIIS